MYYVLIAGCRDFNDYGFMKKYLDIVVGNKKDVTIVHGGAKGADKNGERYAKERGFNIKMFEADWDEYGKGADPIRNEQMAKFLSKKKNKCLCAFWDGESRGTANMIDTANKYDIDTYVFIP